MSTLTVDHLHAHYRASAEEARRLGEDVHPLLGPAVAAALLDVTAVPDAAHVCVPDLELAVELDPRSRPDDNGRTWARALVAALVARLGDPDVVVYHRHADALVDALVGLATGDTTRARAWRQAGVVPPDAPLRSPDEVVPALVREPVLLPAVLLAVLAAGVVPRFEATSWRLLGTAWAEAGHRTATARPVLPDRVPPALARLVRSVPETALDDVAGDSVVAVLSTLLPTAPVRDGATVPAAEAVAVLREAGGPSARRVGRWPGQDTGDETAAERRPADRERGGGAPAAPPQDGAGAVADDRALASDWAGLLLLLGPVEALGVADRVADDDGVLGVLGPAATVAAVARAIAPVPSDDPVLAVLRGADPAAPAELVDPLDLVPADRRADAGAAIDALAVEVLAGVRDLLGVPSDAPLERHWRRHGELWWSPAWVEVTFPIELVDVAVRRAGLDLDPGWVWWLGAVVRFRYA